MHVPAGVVASFEIAVGLVGQARLGGRREVGGAADEPGDDGCERVQHLARAVAAGDAFRVGGEHGQDFVPTFRDAVVLHDLVLLREIGELGLVASEQGFPLGVCGGPALAHVVDEVLHHAVGDEELGVLGPAVELLRATNFVLAERLAVGGGAAFLLRRAVSDATLDDDEGGTALVRLGLVQRDQQRGAVVDVSQAQHGPAVGEKARADILAKRQRGRTLDRDLVAVVNPDEVGQAQVPGDRRGLAGDPFHHVAVAANRVHAVVDDGETGAVVGRGHPAFGDRHADAVGDALAERAGGALDAGRHVILGMPRRHAVHLAEFLDVLERDGGAAGVVAVLVDLVRARQVQERVEKHRRMANREHEAVAVRPHGIDRVEAEPIVP